MRQAVVVDLLAVTVMGTAMVSELVCVMRHCGCGAHLAVVCAHPNLVATLEIADIAGVAVTATVRGGISALEESTGGG